MKLKEIEGLIGTVSNGAIIKELELENIRLNEMLQSAETRAIVFRYYGDEDMFEFWRERWLIYAETISETFKLRDKLSI